MKAGFLAALADFTGALSAAEVAAALLLAVYTIVLMIGEMAKGIRKCRKKKQTKEWRGV